MSDRGSNRKEDGSRKEGGSDPFGIFYCRYTRFIYKYNDTYVSIHVHVHICIRICKYIYIKYIHIYVNRYTYTYVNMCVYVWMYER
jgi:hypothetical protein